VYLEFAQWMAGSLRDASLPVGSRSEAPVGGLRMISSPRSWRLLVNSYIHFDIGEGENAQDTNILINLACTVLYIIPMLW